MYNFFHFLSVKLALFVYSQSSGALPKYRAYYGRGTGPVLFYSIRCNEPKQSIFDCAVSYTNAVRFSHQNNAGVECQRKSRVYSLCCH